MILDSCPCSIGPHIYCKHGKWWTFINFKRLVSATETMLQIFGSLLVLSCPLLSILYKCKVIIPILEQLSYKLVSN